MGSTKSNDGTDGRFFGKRINENDTEIGNAIFHVGKGGRYDRAVYTSWVEDTNDDSSKEINEPVGVPVHHSPSVDDGTRITQDTVMPNNIDPSNEIAADTIEDSRN